MRPKPPILALSCALAALLAGCAGGPEPAGDRPMAGPLALYGRCPPGRDLYLEAWGERKPDGPHAVLRFTKLSSKTATGLRLVGLERLVVEAGGRQATYPAAVGVSAAHPRFLLEQALIEVPLADLDRLAAAGEVRARLGGLSPFSLRPDAIAAVRDAAARTPDASRVPRGAAARRLPRPRITLADLADKAPETGAAGHPVTLTATYAEPGEKTELLVPTGWIDYPADPPPAPLVGRMVEDEGDVPLRPPAEKGGRAPFPEDEALAARVAGIAARAIRAELALARLPALHVVLFPLDAPRPVAIAVPAPVEEGIAIGVPSVGGKVLPAHASRVLLLAHEFTETYFVNPWAGNRSSLYGDPWNRWVGEGLANLVLARARLDAARQGLHLPPLGSFRGLLDAWRAGARTIRLSGWAAGENDDVRYAAAEWLADRWADAARARGHGRPVAEFAAWLRGFPGGPRYPQVMEWMAAAAGLDVAAEAEAVPLAGAIRRQAAAWSALGWPLPEEARRTLAEIDREP